VTVAVEGTQGVLSRSIGMTFATEGGASPVFDFGIASRSEIRLTGNASVEGLNSPDEAKILSATNGSSAFRLTGNVDIEGDIYTSNPDASVSMSGNVKIAGVRSWDPDIWEHIHLGSGTSEFPEVDPTVFEPFATNIVDSSTPTGGNRTFSNIRIAANTNPTFSGNTTLYGVIFVEVPNKVHFSGNATLTGVIVTEDAGDDAYGDNTIKFTGNMTVRGVEGLPDIPEYATLRTMPGAFILAPGFGLQFTGNFGTVSGCIAADSFKFAGNAGGVVEGGIINYSDSIFKLTGNSHIIIDRSSNPMIPPGFDTPVTFSPDPSSYVEYH